MATYYFAYGADMDIDEINLHHDRHRRPRISFTKSTPAVLKGYRLVCDIASKYRQAGIFNVVEDPDGTVHGVIYELRPGDSVSIAAMKEGEDADYSLSVLPVKTRKGEDIPAIVLHAKGNPKELAPSQDYLTIVIRAAKRHGIPAEWIKHLDAQRPSSKTIAPK
jgi:hypothetical protein